MKKDKHQKKFVQIFGKPKIVYIFALLKQTDMKTNTLTQKMIGKFEKAIIRSEITSRGGGIEIDLSSFGFKGERMASYCNYLGGGMLGRVCSDNTINAFQKPCTDKQQVKLDKIAEQLKQYFHSLTNPDEDTWEHQTYEQNQNMSASAY